MKKSHFYAIAVALISLTSCISQKGVPQAERNYQQIIEISATKQELYIKTLEWMAKAFGSSKEVIQFNDPDQGKIIAKGITEVTYTISPVDTYFTLTVELKENRACFTFDQLHFAGKMSLVNEGQIDKFSERAIRIIEDWKVHISRNSADW